MLFPFHVPIYVPRVVWEGLLRALNTLRIIPPRQSRIQHDDSIEKQPAKSGTPTFVQFNFPLNFVTAPLVADLFLLAILAIGRQEVHDGTIGANNISPLDIMLFFLSLAYIAISLDASGLIRYLAFRVLQWGGDVGHRLFFYLYAFFFGLTSFIGNDPIILSGTAFLAYLTRVSSNIVHPRAWIHSQFAVANIGSAILVSSNPTNLVLARAFDIKFINYTANIIVPVLATGIVLFPFLLYIVFADEALIPESIKMHELPEEVRLRKPVNPNIPHARGQAEEDEKEHANDEPGQLLSLEEIMNPFLDKKGAAFGAILMAVTLITLLALNAATTGTGEHPVFWVTLPAAVVQFVWDVALGWLNRHETREIARKGRESIARAKAEREARAEAERRAALEADDASTKEAHAHEAPQPPSSGTDMSNTNGSFEMSKLDAENRPKAPVSMNGDTKVADEALEAQATPDPTPQQPIKPRASFVSLTRDWYKWAQETFPTATTVLAHLPFALVPFAFCMFVLVQGLVTKGWVQVFAYGWDHWINKTGTIGAIGGMGFLSVILCNVSLRTKSTSPTDTG